MSQFLKRMLGIVYVEQQDNVIEIGGAGAANLMRDIKAAWGTSKIEGNMFLDMSKRSIKFRDFYAIEIHYMLQELLKQRRNWTPRNTILAAIKAMEENTWLSGLADKENFPRIFDRSKLRLFKKSPMKHQLEFFDIYEYGRTALGLHGYLLSAAAGSGKTLTNLFLAEMVHSDYVIIVSPNNAVYRVWDKTLREEYNKPQIPWIAGEKKPYKGERFLVTHYEGLPILMSNIGKLHGKVTVILDESHNFNEMSSQRTQTFIEMCERVKSENVLWSSGTPIKALGGECVPLLKTIDPRFTPDVEKGFRAIFGVNAKRALDVLRNRMGFISYRVEKKDVVDNKPTELPPVKVKLPNGSDYTLDAIRQQMKAFITERLEYYKKNYSKYEEIYENCLRDYEDAIATSQERADYKTYRTYIEKIKKYYDPKEMKVRGGR